MKALATSKSSSLLKEAVRHHAPAALPAFLLARVFSQALLPFVPRFFSYWLNPYLALMFDFST
jgi:hypothetical protein